MSRRSIKSQEAWTAFFFILPFTLGFLFFKLLPMIFGLVLGFLDFNTMRSITEVSFSGLDNFYKILNDTIALNGFVLNFIYSLFYVFGSTVITLFLAAQLNQKFFFRTVIRTMIYMPYVTNIIAIAIIAHFLFDPFGGPINEILVILGVFDPPMWLFGVQSALPTVVGIQIWHLLAFPTIVYLAAMQAVPHEIYESCYLDGASSWKIFTKITIPMISPTIFLMVVNSTIHSFQNFDKIFPFTEGGPGVSTRTLAINVYSEAFEFSRFSYASAQSVVMFLIILIITLVQWKAQKKLVHY